MEVETPLAEMPPPSAATAAAVSNGDSAAAVEGNGEAAAEGNGESSNGGVEQPYQGKVGAENRRIFLARTSCFM